MIFVCGFCYLSSSQLLYISFTPVTCRSPLTGLCAAHTVVSPETRCCLNPHFPHTSYKILTSVFAPVALQPLRGPLKNPYLHKQSQEEQRAAWPVRQSEACQKHLLHPAWIIHELRSGHVYCPPLCVKHSAGKRREKKLLSCRFQSGLPQTFMGFNNSKCLAMMV